jgi:hypothetical protein
MNEQSKVSDLDRVAHELLHAPWWARFGLLARIAMLVQASLTSYLLLSAEQIQSLTGNAQSNAVSVGHLVLAGVVLLGWIDVLVNDLPHRVVIESMKHRRLTLFSVLALAYLLEAFVALDSSVNGRAALIIYYLAAAATAAWLAVLQVARYEVAKF